MEASADPNETSAVSTDSLRPGALLKDRYLIEKPLGAGGMGAVFLARDRQLLNRPVVVKALLNGPLQDPWIHKKFKQEMEALARIDHPGVIGVLDAGRTDSGVDFLVMQFVEGSSMRCLLEHSRKDQKPVETAVVASVMRQVGDALSAAHEKGILHCDLKPENIMIQQVAGHSNLVKLIDFGIAKIKDSYFATNTESRVAGTFQYMSPEQLVGKPVQASDVYAMGVIAYEMLCGVRPFRASTPAALMQQQMEGLPPKPTTLRRELSAGVDTILLDALSVNPEERFRSASNFGAALAGALDSDKVLPEVETIALETQAHNANSKRLVVLLMAALIATFIVLSLAYFNRTVTTPRATSEKAIALKSRLSFWLDARISGSQQSFRTAAGTIFQEGDQVQIHVLAGEPGYLYLLNESIADNNKAIHFYILHPSTLNQGMSAVVNKNEKVQIPARGWLNFDGSPGIEKIWIVYSAHPVQELEAIKGLSNPTMMGLIQDEESLRAVRNLLAESSRGVIAEQEATNKTVLLKSQFDRIVHSLILEHS